MYTDIMLQKIDELTRKVNILLEKLKHIVDLIRNADNLFYALSFIC